MSAIPVLLFMAAQGGAIFATAFLLAERFGPTGWPAKAVWMTISYFGWVAFTWLLFGFVLQPDVYLIPAVGTVTALVASLVYLLVWIAAPVVKAKLHG